MEMGESLRQVLAGSSDLPLSAKKQVPIPKGELGLKPSDRQTRQDIIQADYRDQAIREAVRGQQDLRKPVVESKEGGLWGRMGDGLKKLLEFPEVD